MNRELVHMLNEYYSYYDNIEDTYRAKAYKNAAATIGKVLFKITSGNIDKIATLPNIGASIFEKIRSHLGAASSTAILIDSINPLTNIVGIGDKMAQQLASAGYHTIAQVRAGVKSKKLDLTHMQRMGVMYYEDLNKKMTQSTTQHIAQIVAQAAAQFAPKSTLTIVGSYRRGVKLQGDVDLLFCTSAATIEEFLQTLHLRLKNESSTYTNYLSAGSHKLSLLLRYGSVVRHVDVFVCTPDEYPTFLNYATGSFTHNEHLRATAKRLGYKLNQYGLYEIRSNKKVSNINTEKDIYDKLGLDYIKPENR